MTTPPDDLTARLTVTFPNRMNLEEAKEWATYIGAKLPSRVVLNHKSAGEYVVHGREAKGEPSETTVQARICNLTINGIISSYEIGSVGFSTVHGKRDPPGMTIGAIRFAQSPMNTWDEIPKHEKDLIEGTIRETKNYFDSKGGQP